MNDLASVFSFWLLWIIICLLWDQKIKLFESDQIVNPILLCIIGRGLGCSILPLFNPRRFLHTPPPIIQNKHRLTY